MKTKLRVWLIDLLREAIRVESAASSYVPPSAGHPIMPDRTIYPGRLGVVPACKPATIPIFQEPSFEQSQFQALKAQEEYYGKPDSRTASNS